MPVIELENLYSDELDGIYHSIGSNTNKFTQIYQVSNPACTYLSIKLYPSSEMNSVSILVTVKSSYDFEYDLENGFSKYIVTLFTSNTYKFYINAEYGKDVDIELDFDYIYSHSSYRHPIIIYEYSSRNSKTELRQTNQYLSYGSKNKFQTSYKVYNSSSQYVAFKIKPYFQMTAVYVELKVKKHVDGEYDLTSGSSKTLGELYNSGVYIFYIGAKYEETVDIEFFTSDSYSKFSNGITVYEYKSKSDSKELEKKRLSFIFLLRNLIYNLIQLMNTIVLI